MRDQHSPYAWSEWRKASCRSNPTSNGYHATATLRARLRRIANECTLSGDMWPSPVLADEKLYYVSKRGRTFVLEAKPQFNQLAHNDLGDGGVFNASPAIAGRQLLLRSDRFLYCVAKKGK